MNPSLPNFPLKPGIQDEPTHATRPWKAIAEDICRERDPKRMTEMLEELNHALDEQNLDGTARSKPDGRP